MAAPTPFFIIGPNTLISLIGLIRGPDRIVPTPIDDWRKATVDVVIPAYNEEATIILCLDSVRHQTLKANRIVVMDDGSKDRTREIVQKFAAQHNMPIEIMSAEVSIGKTPGVKKNARELKGDVQFVLDGDTILQSRDYIEKTVRELYQGVGIASACGAVMPLRKKDRDKVIKSSPAVREFYKQNPGLSHLKQHVRFRWFLHGIINIYRDFLYFYLKNFIYLGQMTFFGTIVNPIGCAVAYRREYIRELFDHYEPSLGNDLTTSEDIFIGFALLQRGYRNVQVGDVYALSEEPAAHRLPKQLFLWSSSFLQSCYYFPDLVFSPFKVFRRVAKRREEKEQDIQNLRKVKEAYRQAFGTEYTHKYGRPIGWTIMLSLIEKISFPVIILLFIALGKWEMLAWTLGIEVLVLLAVTFILARRVKRMDYIWKAVLATPIRYFTTLWDLFIFGVFLFDIWFVKDHKWRK
jgi:glycosyltransferase involved in cell wall biosynthesis